MLLQVSNPGSANLFSLSLFWEIVFLSLIVAFIIYLIRRYNKSFLWAHQVIHPLQDGFHRWNHQFTDWLQHRKPVNFFTKVNWNYFYLPGKKSDASDSFAEEILENISRKNKPGIFTSEEYDLLVDENKELKKELKEEIEKLKQQLTSKEDGIKELLNNEVAAKQELHTAQVYNSQLKFELEGLIQFREENILLNTKVTALQNELNNITAKLLRATDANEQLSLEVNRLYNVDGELIDAVNYNTDLEQQIERLLPLEADIKSLEAERNMLLVQLQEIKTQKHHEYANLAEAYETVTEEKDQLQDKIVLLEREAGALARSLNNNRQQQNQDALWENKFITAAKELNMMRLQYASLESELSMMRNKEQLLRSKAMQAEGLEQELKLRTVEIDTLQHQLYDCRKN